MQTVLNRLNTAVGRSHLYWGRKPLQGLMNALRDVQPGHIVLDPFCGAGSPALVALLKGARVIAGDLNPMAVFMTRVLLRPVNIAHLKMTFSEVEERAADTILEHYSIRCPDCKKTAHINYLVWNRNKPEAAKIICPTCKASRLQDLTPSQVKRQLEQSKIVPKRWFPRRRIQSNRKPPVSYHHELFTGRNLAALSELFHHIKGLPDSNRKDALRALFAGTLGHHKGKEVNVWVSFSHGFKRFLELKRELNAARYARVAESADDFFDRGYEALVVQSDPARMIRDYAPRAQTVALDPFVIHGDQSPPFSIFAAAWLGMKWNCSGHVKKINSEEIATLLRSTTKDTRVCWLTGGRAGQTQDAEPPPLPYGTGEKKIIHEAVYPYLRVAAFLEAGKGAEEIRARGLIPDRLQAALQGVGVREVKKATKDAEANRRAFQTLCLTLIREILKCDGWRITRLYAPCFEDGAFGLSLKKFGGFTTEKPEWAFEAGKGKRSIKFYFQTNCKPKKETDKRHLTDFKDIRVLVLPSRATMNELRQPGRSDRWPDGFFISIDEIRERCGEAASSPCADICGPLPKVRRISEDTSRIASFRAEVMANIPVGEGNPNHFKLRFSAPDLPNPIPGQFVMIDTSPARKTNVKPKSSASVEGLSPKPDLGRESFLKRPFGIHRAFYPGFPTTDYLKNLSLPPTLATTMHTVFPDEFDILYKLLKNGVGTNQLKELKKGQKVKMIGPLGKRFDLRALRSQGINEVHVIGGGVGMAPLIFLVQALRFFNFDIRAFIGIESMEALKYRDILDKGFSGEPKDTKLYVDDLLAAGVKGPHIHISCDKKGETVGGVVKEENFHNGLVGEQYKAYLKRTETKNRKNILAFSCGPWPMMKQVHKIAQSHNIGLKLLLEKRMACGFGVCFSCVCKTKKNGEEHYSRVCVDGPVFDSGEIVWQETD